MTEFFQKFDILFAWIGLCTICFVVIFVCIGLFELIKEFVQTQIKIYKRKHRFDKKPIAQCYCIDCIFRKSNGLCEKGNINHSYDAWFCDDAIPHK